MTVKDIYISRLAHALSIAHEGFIDDFPTSALAQSRQPVKFDNLSFDRQELFIKAAHAAFEFCAPDHLKEQQ